MNESPWLKTLIQAYIQTTDEQQATNDILINEENVPYELYQMSLIDYKVQETKLYHLENEIESEMAHLGNPDIDDFDNFVNRYRNH